MALTVPKGHRLFQRTIDGSTYGVVVPENWRDDHALLLMFGKFKAGVEGRHKYNCWKAWVQEHWPEPIFMWDRWSTLFFSAACGYAAKITELTGFDFTGVTHDWWRYVLMAGNASSGKSSRVGMWVLGNWVVDQSKTSCVLTSTSIDQLKRRIWSEVLKWISESRIGFKDILEVVASDTLIREPSRDEPMNTKSAIFGRAVDQGGSTQAAVDRIKGLHNERVTVVCDEMSSMPPAITKACRNMKKGTKEFQFFGMANPNPENKEDEHSQYCEPLAGWNDVTVDDEFWLTAKGGACVHFDGLKSPGILEPEKYHFYTNQKDIDEDLAFFGGENDPGFQSETRGFWPTQGISNVVIDPALFDQFKVSEWATFQNKFIIGAFMDPAFEGGDRRIIQPFKLGEFTSGVTGIELQKPKVVSVDMTQDTRWLHYSIGDAAQEFCENYVDEATGKVSPILPANFMMDTSGEGGGLFSIMSGRWSPDILACEFGGAADKDQIFPDRPTTYYEEYANRVTMLYYVLRRFIEGGQIKGLTDPETRHELGARSKDKPRGGKKAILPKHKVKGFKKKSPDKADAVVGCAEFMRKRGVVFAGTTGATNVISVRNWNKWADRMNQEGEGFADEGANFA